MKLSAAAFALALSLPLVLSAPARAQQITGAGATFPAPVYAKWGEDAKSIGIELNYQAIGSGGGQNQIVNRTVDFGASDAPMDADRLRTANLLQFPTVMGAVVVVVNLPGIKSNAVKLTGTLLGDIYGGRITRWNDPRIAEINPETPLPNLAIAPVYRADGSGTTFVFTSYLSAAGDGWKDRVGANTSVKWPAGTGAKGNDGIAATVKNLRGAIGYVENAYATQTHLDTVQLRNRDGQFVTPTVTAFAAAATSAGDWAGARDFAVDLVDRPGPTSWPIVSATFLLVPKDPKDAARAAAVLRFVNRAYSKGDEIAQSLEYIPLPKAVQDRVRASWSAVMVDGKPVDWK